MVGLNSYVKDYCHYVEVCTGEKIIELDLFGWVEYLLSCCDDRFVYLFAKIREMLKLCRCFRKNGYFLWVAF